MDPAFTQPIVALKVDVDTYIGTRDGVPRLLEILGRFGIRATFYFSLGPDNSGKALRRIFKPGFLKKQLRSGAPSAFGLRTLLSGTLLPAPVIGKKLPDVMRSVERAGHEAGIHCWDHVKWHDCLPWFPKSATALELGKAGALFEEVFGHQALTTAAPGWTVTADSLDVQDAMQLAFASDSRGTAPFYPEMGGRTFRTLQIPTTWPTMDELLGADGITPATINDRYLALLKPGLNVHTIHTEFEGAGMADVFTDLLVRLTARNVTFVTLSEAAAKFGADAPAAPLAMTEIPGRAMPVAVQGH